MYMNKICTDVIQSKKLIELGIDVNTADMYYSFDYNIEEYEEDAQIIPKSELGEHFSLFPEDIPAWSLSAMFSVLPKEIEIDGQHYAPCLFPVKSKWLLKLWYNSNYTITSPKSIFSDNPVDAAFEMVVWLLENNKITNKKL